MKRIMISLLMVLLLLLASNALAMFSTNYRLDWFTPLTSGGGGASQSANYVVSITIGQTGSGVSASDSFHICLGYWCADGALYRTYLPLVIRN